MKHEYRLGTIAGIDIDIHYTWLFAFALITWTLAVSWFPSSYPDWNRATYWAAGAISALMLFGSVLVHELAHSLVALARGMPVRGITLFIFGGMSNIGGETRSARDEFQIAIVGPASSLALAALLWLALRAGVGGDDTPFRAILVYLSFVNLLVGVFNLLPGFPLDGGRVLRSLMWHVTGDETRSSVIAANVGIGFGWLLIGLGVLSALTGGIVAGVWTGFIGWFLKDAAEAVRRAARGTYFRDVPVRAVMSAPGPVIHPDATIETLVNQVMVPHGARSVPVVSTGRVVGIATLHDVEAVRRELWGLTPVFRVMTGPPLLAVVPDEGMSTVIAMMSANPVNQVLVLENDALAGVITRADADRFTRVRDSLGSRRS